MSDLENQLDLQTRYALQAQKMELELKQLNQRLVEQLELFREHSAEDKEHNERHIFLMEKISENLDKLNYKVDLGNERLKAEIEKINKLDEIQNEQLRLHIAGVNTLRDMFEMQKKEVERRLTSLEKPREWWKITKKGIIGLGTLAGAVYAILKLLEVF